MARACILTLVALALLIVSTAAGRDDDNALPPEVQKLLTQQQRRNAARAEAAAKELAKVKPILYDDPDSLAMHGDGMDGRAHGLRSLRHGANAYYLLAGGTLYYQEGADFNRCVVHLYLDPKEDAAQIARRQLEESREWERVLKKLPPDVARRFGGEDTEESRKRQAEYVKRLNDVRTPVDLALMQSLSFHDELLKGTLALTPQQAAQIKRSLAKYQDSLEELGKLAQALTQEPADPAARRRVFEKLHELKKQRNTPAGQPRDFYTLGQHRALGLEPDPAAKPRPQRAVSAAVSSGGDDPTSPEMAEMLDRYEKQRARAEMEERSNRRSARVRCQIQGKDAAHGKWSVRTADGLLWMYADVRDGGARFLFYLDEEKVWAAERAEQLRESEMYEAQAKKDPTYEEDTPEEAKFSAEQKAQYAKAPNYHSANWSYPIGRLRFKTGSVPADVQARFDKMVKDVTDAGAAALAAYRAAAVRPGDPQLQRALFEAVRQAVRAETRGNILLWRQYHDEEGTADGLPWLLSMDQVDLINRGQLSTGSEASSGSSGSLGVIARPAGKKQYVSVTGQGMNLGELAEAVQRVARKYYHNHRLALAVDPKAAENPVRGLVEGKSAEELFKSLANRSGVTLAKDEKTPHLYRLKP